MGAGHDHSHGSAGLANRSRLVTSFLLGLSIVVVQLIGAWLSHSLALLADAGHSLTDVAGIGLAIVAITLAARPTRSTRTFGLFRLEILVAVANGIILLALSIYILIEAYERWQNPSAIKPWVMILAALYGVVANTVSIMLLKRGAKDSLAVKGAYLEVLSDALGSAGVVIAGLVILVTGWDRADVVVSIVIALFMIPRTLLLLRDSFGVLMENSPPGIDPEQVRQAVLAVDGVTAVHELHIWSITSGMPSLSAHVIVDCNSLAQQQTALRQVETMLHDTFAVAHTTIQMELSPDCGPVHP